MHPQAGVLRGPEHLNALVVAVRAVSEDFFRVALEVELVDEAGGLRRGQHRGQGRG